MSFRIVNKAKALESLRIVSKAMRRITGSRSEKQGPFPERFSEGIAVPACPGCGHHRHTLLNVLTPIRMVNRVRQYVFRCQGCQMEFAEEERLPDA